MRNRTTLAAALAPAVVMVLAGCASMFSKSNYPVAISSNPSGARVTVTDPSGNTVFEGVTPTTVTLKASKGFFEKQVYTVRGEKGGRSGVGIVSSGIDGWYFANLLLGGVLGMLIIDPATGAMWRLDQQVTIHLHDGSAMQPAEDRLHIVSVHDVPEHLRAALVPLAGE